MITIKLSEEIMLDVCFAKTYASFPRRGGFSLSNCKYKRRVKDREGWSYDQKWCTDIIEWVTYPAGV